jgi:heme oxygenase
LKNRLARARHVDPDDAMQALRIRTRPAHQRLEKRLHLGRRFEERALYADHLSRMCAFHQAAEPAWTPHLAGALPDFEQRRKADLLLADLAFLDARPAATPRLPVVSGTASALGAFYVLEGATLGGRHLSSVVSRTLGLAPERGAAYLASYGERVDEMWATFARVVNERCATASTREAAVTAALLTFAAVEDCLCEAAPAAEGRARP